MTPDVVVIGAGPAGCAAATVLAERGHTVLLIDRPSGARRALAESIPPSARRILAELGMADAVVAEGFQPWRGNTVWWADAPPRAETFAPDASGFQVERDRFDAVLRKAAIAAGARLVAGTVRTVARPLVVVEVDGRLVEVTAPWVVDCSGRAGVIARRELRDTDAAHRTVALAGVWRADRPWPDQIDGHTLVASHADGWAWSVPVSRHVRYVTVMVDPVRSHLAKAASSREIYLAELAKVTPFADVLAHARLEDGPWGADASLYGTRAHAGAGFLLAGDASAFIDPLSSFGVKKALASGWLAGVVLHTILETPAMQDAALAFFEARERLIAASLRQQTTRYADQAGAEHPFWQARTAPTLFQEEDVRPEDLARDADVIQAVRDLQARPSAELVAGPDARVAPRPLIRDRRLVLEDHLILPAWPGGLRYIRNVDVVLTWRLAQEHRDIGELFEAIATAQPGIALPDVLGVVGTLVAKGGLRHKV